MVKHTQTSLRQQPTNRLGVFDHFVGLALKGLILRKVLETSAFSESLRWGMYMQTDYRNVFLLSPSFS